MGVNARIGKVADATVTALTITWTTNDPTASTAATVADGDAVASTESGVLFKTMNAQIAALTADVLAIRNQLNAGE